MWWSTKGYGDNFTNLHFVMMMVSFLKVWYYNFIIDIKEKEKRDIDYLGKFKHKIKQEKLWIGGKYTRTYIDSHTGSVRGVSCSPVDHNIFASCGTYILIRKLVKKVNFKLKGYDGLVNVYDVRKPLVPKKRTKINYIK